MRKFTIWLSCLFVMASIGFAYAQTKTITGKITSASDGMPIPGVTVMVPGTTTGTTTDLDGKYVITIDNKVTKLRFQYMGMITQEILIENNTTINVVMKEDLLQLDEVIVVAYGSASKSGFTGSASQVSSEKIESRPISNITSAIEGQAAGIQVTAGDGQPGSSQDIRVRGFGSYTAENAPLYVIDGIPFDGQFSSINPQDIETLTILKDASSTALYGSRAANGVVLITTKKGKLGEGQLTFDVSYGFVSRAQKEYDRIGPDDYYEIMWESLRNSYLGSHTLEEANTMASSGGNDGIYAQLVYNPYNVANDEIVLTNGQLNPNAKLLYADDLDWLGAVTKPGNRTNYNLTYSGATTKADYFISLGYLEENGWIIESNFNRYSGRANVNFKANNWLKTGFNLNFAHSKGDQAQTASDQNNSVVNPIRFTRQMGPIYPIHAHNEDGSYVLDDNGDEVFDLGSRASGASSGRHIVAEILWDMDVDEITSIGAKAYVDINLTRNLKFTSNYGWDQRIFANKRVNNGIVGDGAPGGRSYRTHTKTTTKTFNQILNYTKTFAGVHNFSGLIGHESYDLNYEVFSGSKTETIMDGNIEFDNYVNLNAIHTRLDKEGLESYFSRFNYDYNGKYFLSASYRRDGSSRFYKDSRWGDFWSVGGAWRIDQEDFMDQFDWINMLKLRASYGQVGNNKGIGYYPWQALYELGWNNQFDAGIYQASLAARDLVWESNNAFDIALEFGIFNKLFGTIEYYNRASEDLIFEVPLPPSLGLDDVLKNIGQLVNRGFELTVNYEAMKRKDFKWDISANFSTLHNEFTKMPQKEIINGTKKLMVGKGLYDFWLFDWYGVNPDNGDALYIANDVEGEDVFIIGNDTVTPNFENAKEHYAGSAIPDLMGSITNTLSYKNFELSFMFTYQIGGKVIDYNYKSIMSSGTYGTALSTDILDRWQNPGDITNVPRMDAGETTNFNGTSDRWLTDASFLALRQAILSYNIPQSFLSKWGISSARVYCSGENLFLINARKGMNNQQSFAGTTSNGYTPLRVITIGLNVKF